MNKILVTGATGFVGGSLVPHLLATGWDVRVFVRDADRLEKPIRDQVEIVQGCLERNEDVARAVSGCSHLIHLAALAQACVKDPRDYFRINTDSVEMLLRSARSEGIKRFVHVSSVLALPPVQRSTAWGIPRRPTYYGESKRASELLVQKYIADGHDAVIVRPGRIYGPGPWNDANGVTRMMAMYLDGRFRIRLADKGVQANYVHVDDVAAGLALAARKGRTGRAYALGGTNVSLVEFLHTVAEITGVHHRVRRTPPQAVLPLAHLCSWWGRCGGSVSLTPAWLNNFLEHRPLDITTSREDLGYAPRSLRKGLSQTLNWILGIGGGEQNVYRAIHRFQKSAT